MKAGERWSRAGKVMIAAQSCTVLQEEMVAVTDCGSGLLLGGCLQVWTRRCGLVQAKSVTSPLGNNVISCI